VLLPALAAPETHRKGSYSRLPVAVVRTEDQFGLAMRVLGAAATGLNEVRCKVLGSRICRTLNLVRMLVVDIVVAVVAVAEVVDIVLESFVAGLGTAVVASASLVDTAVVAAGQELAGIVAVVPAAIADAQELADIVAAAAVVEEVDLGCAPTDLTVLRSAIEAVQSRTDYHSPGAVAPSVVAKRRSPAVSDSH